MTIDDFNLRADLREVNGEWKFIKGLNEARVEAIRILLAGQSTSDAVKFDAQIADLLHLGYKLTSLLVDLRRPSTGPSKQWTCTVRPKIGARAVSHSQTRKSRPSRGRFQESDRDTRTRKTR